jgi:hypothetical protein
VLCNRCLAAAESIVALYPTGDTSNHITYQKMQKRVIGNYAVQSGIYHFIFALNGL